MLRGGWGLALILVVAVVSSGCQPAGNSGGSSASRSPAEPASGTSSPRPAPPTVEVGLAEVGDSQWPMWGGTPTRNLVNGQASNLPVEWDVESGAHVKWTAALGTVAYGNPVVAGGKVFVGTNNGQPRDPEIEGDRGVLMAFDAETGEFLWQDVYDKLPEGRTVDYPEQGICSSPAVDDDRVYYVTNRGQIVCADTEGFRDGENDGPLVNEPRSESTDADIVWRFDMIAELGVQPHHMSSSHPLVVGGRIFASTSNGVGEDGGELARPAAPSFVALDAQTGELLWAEGAATGDEYQVRMGTIHDGQWGSPAYGVVPDGDGGSQEQIYFPAGDGWLYTFALDSPTLLWKFNCNPEGAEWSPRGVGDLNQLIATPVFDRSRVFIATGLDPELGSGPGRLVCIDATGSGDVTSTHRSWSVGGEAFGRSISTVAVYEDLVFAAELDGFLHCFDANAGRAFWEHDTLAQLWGSPLVADGLVYLADEDGDVNVLRAASELEVLAENMSDSGAYGTPVAVGQTLYYATRDTLYAIEMDATNDASP